MMHLILGDAELELVPQEIQGHPSIVKYARKRNKRPSNILLDATYHHQAIRSKYGVEAERRGRPDIVHFFLINAQESILNREGKLRVYVHTRNNQVLFFKPEVRIPKSYPRFVGLMENLFHNGAVPSKEKPLITLESMSLKELALGIGAPTFLLSEKGKDMGVKELKLPENVTIILGGFPHGDFLSNVDFVDEKVSIYPGTLMAWVAAYEIIAEYERRYIF